MAVIMNSRWGNFLSLQITYFEILIYSKTASLSKEKINYIPPQKIPMLEEAELPRGEIIPEVDS